MIERKEAIGKSRLYGIQDVAVEIAETISTMLQVEVEIIDQNHMLIAGTGNFRKKINMCNEDEGHAYQAVLERGEKMVITNPSRDHYCRNCKNKETCGILLEIGYPIICNDHVEGVVGITCWEESRRAFFAENLERSLFFVEHMCELLAEKITERTTVQTSLATSKMFYSLLGHVDKGLVILDKWGTIVEANTEAKEIFREINPLIGKQTNVILTDGTVDHVNTYRVVIEGRVFTVVGTLENFENQNSSYSRILIFQTPVQYRNRLMATENKKAYVGIDSILGKSEYVSRLKKQLLIQAENVVPVYLSGESGTGKKLAAAAMWKAGPRKDRPFYYLDCTTYKSQELQDLLFGVDKKESSIITATKNQVGLLEKLSGGMIHIDAVDVLDMPLQEALYHVICDQKIQRRNAITWQPVDVRFIFSSNQNLLKLMEEGKFQKDLYYCINAGKISFLPLRKHREDIREYVEYFIKEYSEKYQVYIKEMAPETMELLVNHRWFGNVDELKTVIEYMVNALEENGVMDNHTLPESFGLNSEYSDDEIIPIDELERREIAKAIDFYGDTKNGKEKAAEALGIGIATLYRKL